MGSTKGILPLFRHFVFRENGLYRTFRNTGTTINAFLGVNIELGLCLEFFGLQEKLKAGRTTNMLEVAESLQTAGRIIRL